MNKQLGKLFSFVMILALILMAAPVQSAQAATPGDIVINEIMQNPNAVFDSAGEWFELYNTTSSAVDVNGWTIADNDIDSHVINNGGPLLIPAGGYLVLGNNTDTGTNGGAPVDYSYGSSWFLSNGADEVVLLDGSMAEIDRVEYDGGTAFPDPTGASMALSDPALDNNVGANWCTSTTPFGAGDFGTPGAANDCVSSLPQIVINEIMQNPNAVFDSAGEWFELYNAGDGTVDVNGWTIADNDFDSHVINNGGPLLIPAGGYLVLGNNTDTGTNGGAPVDYSYGGSWFLSNGADEVVLLDGSMAEIDRVEYDGGTAFPDPTGASMALSDPALDNNVGANWCTSTTPFGAGDLGTPGAENTCVAPVANVKIHEVQGAGSASPLVGQTVAIEGIVVGDFQDDVGANGDLNGFFVQEEDADADGNALTSEGVFVFQGSNPSVDVVIGDLVRVEGSVSEFFGDTQITSFSGVSVISSGNPLPAASVLSLPVTDINDFEAYEGMYVTFPQPLVISEYFNFDRFGEIVLTDARHFQPTAVFEPGSLDAANLALANSLARITLDDGRTSQNPDPAIHPNGLEFDLTNLFRGGDTVENVTGVINYAFGLYRVQPTQGANYTSVNPRPASPDPIGGNVSVASFNVLNYFSTIDAIQDDSGPNNPADDVCGPLQNQECRGADDANEFTRQRDKIIAAIAAIDADVVGLMEIENHPGDVPTADLVSGLNDLMGAGTYDYIATGALGSDAIRQAFIYKPAAVSPVGDYAVLDTLAFLDPNNTGSDKNRPALAQTFSVNSTGGVFTAVVNHLKSKGSGCGAGDDDPEQGSCNLTRTLAAQVLLNWLATDPTNSDDEDFMIIGDLNAYDKEDPIDVLTTGGYTDLAYEFQGEFAYSFVFSGQWGYLDYALSNAALLSKVTGVTEWHINADEADLIDYDTSFKQDAQDAIYAPDAYRASDHDPVIVGMELTTEAEIYELIDDVQGLLDDGVLNGGQANALISKLENVLTKLANGNPNSAANQLDAFINQVEDFVNDGILTAEQGDALIKSAALLVEALNN
ncbi:MAG TPA: ExeM/NucH family extracellular endonuclease [Anaerolineales bacterium]|nr:ExeM/NucH family extracellular endonuclease [Anaerolineales bacterium]